MPAPKQPITHAPTLTLRRVRHVGVGFTTNVLQADGSIRRVEEWAKFGDEVALSPQELARLSAHGALGPEGATVEDLVAEREQVLQAYQLARRNVAEVGY